MQFYDLRDFETQERIVANTCHGPVKTNRYFVGKQLSWHYQGEPLVFSNNLEKNIETTQQASTCRYCKAIIENIYMDEH